jgi:heat-inducible transcriptional repressor
MPNTRQSPEEILNQLNRREREILRAVIQHFILTATPVGSRQLSRHHGLDWSPATIRNVMADLEEMGLLAHPHTSAGRVPSDLGYRLYVDDLMQAQELSAEEQEQIEREFDGVSQDMDEIMAATAKVLSSASKLLGIVMVPALDDAILHRIDIVRLAGHKVLVVISLDKGPVRTIMVELEQNLTQTQAQTTAHALNSRLSGLPLSQVRTQIAARIGDLTSPHTGLVRFFVDSAERLFSFSEKDEVKIGGRATVLSQPEFSDPRSMRGIIELIEDKDIIVHLLQSTAEEASDVHITIGSENSESRAKDLSVLMAGYRTSTVSGKLGVIGPTRMDYSRMTSLVRFAARMIDRHLSGGSTLR